MTKFRKSIGRTSYSKWGHEDMDRAKWMPVIFLDDDGGVVWNCFSDEIFINDFDNIEEIISFEISK